MNLTIRFKDSGVPKTGLTPSINIIDVTNINSPAPVSLSHSVVEIGSGFYGFDFSEYTINHAYLVYLDGGISLSAVDRYREDGIDVDGNMIYNMSADIKDLAEGITGFDAIKAVVDVTNSAVSLISNSTKNTWAGPEEVTIPDLGSVQKRIYMSIFNNSGSMEDPDGEHIQVKVYDSAGVDVTTDYLTGVEPVYMTRDGLGQYYVDFLVASTDTEKHLRFKHLYYEDGDLVVRDGVVQLVTVSGDVTDKLLEIEDKVDTVIADVENSTYGLSAIHLDIENIDGDIVTLSGDVGDVGVALSEVGTDVSLIAVDVVAVSGQIDGVSEDLADIKGVGFDTARDSLVKIKEAITGYLGAGGTIEGLFEDMEYMFNEDIKGTGFSAVLDTLHQISLRTQSIKTDTLFMMDVEGGSWELVEPNDLIFYKADGVTEVARFKCFNNLGVPAIDGVTSCERV